MNIIVLKSLILFVIICYHFYNSSEKILNINKYETSFDIYKKDMLSQVFNYHIKDKNVTHIFYQLIFYKTMNIYPKNYLPYLVFRIKNDEKDYILEDYKIEEFLNRFHIKIKLHQFDKPKYYSFKFLSKNIIKFIHKKFYSVLLCAIFFKLLINIIKQFQLRNKSLLNIYNQVLLYDFLLIIVLLTKIYQLNIYYSNENYDLNNWNYKLILSFFAFFSKINQYVLVSFIVALTYNGENIEFNFEFLFTIFFKISGNIDLNFKEVFNHEYILVYFTLSSLFIGFPLLTYGILRKLYKLKCIFQNNLLKDQSLYSDIGKTIEIKFKKILYLTISFMFLMIFYGILYFYKQKVNNEVYDILYSIVMLYFSCSVGYIYSPILLPNTYDTSLETIEQIKIKRYNIFKIKINQFNYSSEEIKKFVYKYEKEFNDYGNSKNMNENGNYFIDDKKYIPFIIINPYTQKKNEKISLKNLEGLFIGEKKFE